MERSSLELMSIFDETFIDSLGAGNFRFGRYMRDALAEREGLSLVALHSADTRPDRAAMVARGIASQDPIDFRLRVKPPGHDWDEAVFSLEILLDPGLPRGSHFLAKQHKPHLLRVPGWMRHANGARYVAGVTYLAEDPQPVLDRLQRMFGAAVDRGTCWEAAIGQGVFRVLRPENWRHEFGDTARPAVRADEPCGVAIDVAVEDLPRAEAPIARADIRTVPTR